MIMGLGASRFWWPQGLIECLQERRFRPAVFDLRDSGESTHVARASTASPYRTMLRRRQAAYSAEDLVDDAAAVLDALEWPAAHLLGLPLVESSPNVSRCVTPGASLPSRRSPQGPATPARGRCCCATSGGGPSYDWRRSCAAPEVVTPASVWRSCGREGPPPIPSRSRPRVRRSHVTRDGVSAASVTSLRRPADRREVARSTAKWSRP